MALQRATTDVTRSNYNNAEHIRHDIYRQINYRYSTAASIGSLLELRVRSLFKLQRCKNKLVHAPNHKLPPTVL